MHNRQGLSLREIWTSVKDYDMWPLYALGLLFGLPKYPVNQYLTLSLRSLGFNVITTNLLTIPASVGSMITNFGITALSELINNRSFVAMAEDAWLLPCFIALVVVNTLTPWGYFAIATVLLSFPYTHAIQVAWTSRNAGTVQNRTVSASLYNMWVQVSAMIGANIYQASGGSVEGGLTADKPRYLKANRGLIVICVWMCFVQYPSTYFYYRWRNRTKARKWDAMSAEERDQYLKTTTDVGNKRWVVFAALIQGSTFALRRDVIVRIENGDHDAASFILFAAMYADAYRRIAIFIRPPPHLHPRDADLGSSQRGAWPRMHHMVSKSRNSNQTVRTLTCRATWAGITEMSHSALNLLY